MRSNIVQHRCVDSVKLVDAEKRFELLTPSMSANPMVGGRLLPMAEDSLEGIQDNKGKHVGWRSKSYDATDDSNVRH